MHIIKVIFVNTNSLSIKELLGSSFLSSENINDIKRFKMEENQKEKACSYILKNKYIKEYHVNENGKPISNDIYFNVSHSKGAVVFSKDTLPIGIDIEKIREYHNDLSDYISSNEEKDYTKDSITFYEVWTNKESLTKCIGTGIKEKIKDIPSLPINGKKTYKEKAYFSNTVKYKDYIISITRESDSPFEIEITEEQL